VHVSQLVSSTLRYRGMNLVFNKFPFDLAGLHSNALQSLREICTGTRDVSADAGGGVTAGASAVTWTFEVAFRTGFALR